MKLSAAAQELRQAAEESLSGSDGSWYTPESTEGWLLEMTADDERFVSSSTPQRILALLSALEAVVSEHGVHELAVQLAKTALTQGTATNRHELSRRYSEARKGADSQCKAALAACRAAGLIEEAAHD